VGISDPERGPVDGLRRLLNTIETVGLSGVPLIPMTPFCPVCKEPMKEHGRSFQCEPCRQFMVFFDVSDVLSNAPTSAQREHPEKTENEN